MDIRKPTMAKTPHQEVAEELAEQISRVLIPVWKHIYNDKPVGASFCICDLGTGKTLQDRSVGIPPEGQLAVTKGEARLLLECHEQGNEKITSFDVHGEDRDRAVAGFCTRDLILVLTGLPEEWGYALLIVLCERVRALSDLEKRPRFTDRPWVISVLAGQIREKFIFS